MATSKVQKSLFKRLAGANITPHNHELRENVAGKFGFVKSMNMGVEGTGKPYYTLPSMLQFSGYYPPIY